jgi:hypothetical protein
MVLIIVAIVAIVVIALIGGEIGKGPYSCTAPCP